MICLMALHLRTHYLNIFQMHQSSEKWPLSCVDHKVVKGVETQEDISTKIETAKINVSYSPAPHPSLVKHIPEAPKPGEASAILC